MTSILDSQDDALTGLMAPATTATGEEGYRERSANMINDPKMRELQKFTKTHAEDVQAVIDRDATMSPVRRAMASAAGGRAATPSAEEEGIPSRVSLRNEGCSKVNRHMRGLWKGKAELPKMGSNSELPEAFHFHKLDDPKEAEKSLDERREALRRFDRGDTQMEWRGTIDHGLRRLMLDMELARDDRLKKSADKARCDHLDKCFDWYRLHGHKEPKKSKPAPPYVRFSVSGPVMPGSLRVAPKTRESATSALQAAARGSRAEPGLGHSSSLPSLTAIGSGMDQTLYPQKAGF